MKFVKLAFIGVIAAASVTAQAQSTLTKGMHGEIGYTSINYTDSGYAPSPAGVVRVLIGNEFHENFAVEGMAGFGTNEGSFTATGVAVKRHIDNMFGIYLKPKAKLSDVVEVFGRIGYANIATTGTNAGVTDSTSVGSASYGVGASFNLNRTTALNVDYMTYYNKDGVKAGGPTFGVGFRF